MMPIVDKTNSSSFKEIFITLVLGVMIGALTVLFFKMLGAIASLQAGWNNQPYPWHLLAMPVVLFFLVQIKKRTLYFPGKVSELVQAKQTERDVTTSFWSVWMSLWHFVGTGLSHLVGASVGREGALVLISSGLVRLLRLSWMKWGPVAASIGFATVVGHFWVAPVFMAELFYTNIRQKIYALLGAQAAAIVFDAFQIEHLMPDLSSRAEFGFFQKFFFVVVLAFLAGWCMRLYKKFYFQLVSYFARTSIFVRLFVGLLLAVFLFQPELRHYQSLGLFEIPHISQNVSHLQDVIIKLFVTLISVSIGFFGGEFVPLVFSSLHLGNLVSQWMGFDIIVGTYLAAYLFFAGATRLKWTSYLLLLSLVGLGWWFWAYVLTSLTVSFSKEKSLYRLSSSN